MHTPQDPLYTKTPLPPVATEAIRILFNNTNTHSLTHSLPPSFMHTPQDPLYTKTTLPPVAPEAIQILFNNTNALQIENKVILAKSIKNYTKHEPTIL
jgi:hypothetical protein